MSQTVDLVKPKVWPMIAFFLKWLLIMKNIKAAERGKKSLTDRDVSFCIFQLLKDVFLVAMATL